MWRAIIYLCLAAEKLLKAIYQPIQGVVTAALLLRVQVGVSLVSAVVLVVPEQVREVYRALAEDAGAQLTAIIAGFVMFGALTYLIWYSGRWITLTLRQADLGKKTIECRSMRWIPRVTAIVPGLALGAALLLASAEITGSQSDLVEARLHVAGVLLILATSAFGLWTIFRARGPMAERYKSDVNLAVFRPSFIIVYGLLPIVLFVATFSMPIVFPTMVGTMFLIGAFFSVTVFLLSIFVVVYERTGAPIIATLIGLAVLWSLLDINDNHAVRTVESRERTKHQAIDRAFADWLDAREDRDHYQNLGKRYPVYIVAAEGGGIYAAHHASIFLARLQDLCPTFAQHVFAISAVSGGSVGASIFSGLTAGNKARDVAAVSNGNFQECSNRAGSSGKFELAVDDILSNDLISPLAAGFLVTDFTQRFLPVPIPALDRARALEDSILAAWGTGTNGEFLNRPMSATWSAEGVSPALLLNTTEVETGRRVPMAPFPLTPTKLKTQQDYLQINEDISLVTASVLSARFTYLTPAGFFFDAEAGKKSRFVDGGYFENSGIETALDVIEKLRDIAKDKGAEIRLIPLLYTEETASTRQYWGESLSPVRALLAARMQRGRLAQYRAVDSLSSPCPNDSGEASQCDDVYDITDPVRESVLHTMGADGESVSFPLGWKLSGNARALVREQVGWPAQCRLRNFRVDAPPDDLPIDTHNNACTLRFIQLELENGV